MSILDLPTEILRDILSYNMLPCAISVCRELHEIERALEDTRLVYLQRYNTVVEIAEDDRKDMMVYMIHVHSPIPSFGDISYIVSRMNRRYHIIRRLLIMYLRTFSIEDLFTLRRILTYDELSSEMDRRGMNLQSSREWPERNIVIAAVKDRDWQFMDVHMARKGYVSYEHLNVMDLRAMLPVYMSIIDMNNVWTRILPQDKTDVMEALSACNSKDIDDALTSLYLYDRSLAIDVVIDHIRDIKRVPKLQSAILDHDDRVSLERLRKKYGSDVCVIL